MADTTNKLSRKHKDYVLQKLAQWWRPYEIVAELKEGAEFDGEDLEPIEVSQANVGWYRKNRADLIAEKRSQWLQSIESIPLANKAKRIEELSQMYGVLKKNTGGVYTEDTIKELRGLLEQIRKEVEGDVHKIHPDSSLDINITEEKVES